MIRGLRRGRDNADLIMNSGDPALAFGDVDLPDILTI